MSSIEFLNTVFVHSFWLHGFMMLASFILLAMEPSSKIRLWLSKYFWYGTIASAVLIVLTWFLDYGY